MNCGKKDVIVRGDYLENGDTKSCGCLNYSFNEDKIKKMLVDSNINFIQQYSFDDLLNSDTNHKLFFDFAILNEKNDLQYLLEYDGI